MSSPAAAQAPSQQANFPCRSSYPAQSISLSARVHPTCSAVETIMVGRLPALRQSFSASKRYLWWMNSLSTNRGTKWHRCLAWPWSLTRVGKSPRSHQSSKISPVLRCNNPTWSPFFPLLQPEMEVAPNSLMKKKIITKIVALWWSKRGQIALSSWRLLSLKRWKRT